MPGLGRVHAPDDRDQRYLLRDVAPPVPTARVSRYWNDSAWWGNQGDTPWCTAYAWLHEIADGPVTHAGKNPIAQPSDLYALEKTLDGIGGEGSTVRAGAQAMVNLGHVGEYRWAWDLATMITALLEVGPVVVGINWYDSFDVPDVGGVVRLPRGATIRGGHAFEVNGVSTTTGLVRAKQSWQRSEYGKNGHFYLPFEVVDRLLAEDGEVCLPRELPV